MTPVNVELLTDTEYIYENNRRNYLIFYTSK